MLPEAVDLGPVGQLDADLHQLIGQGEAAEGRVEDDGPGGDARHLEGEHRLRRERHVVQRVGGFRVVPGNGDWDLCTYFIVV